MQIKSARPVGKNRQHLVWILDAMREYAKFVEVLRAPPKCGPPENAKALGLVAEESFGGVGVVPACGEEGGGKEP